MRGLADREQVAFPGLAALWLRGQRMRGGAGVMRLECEGVEVPHLRRTQVEAISDATDNAVTG